MSIQPIDQLKTEHSNMALSDLLEDLLNGIDRLLVDEGIWFGLTQSAASQMKLAMSGIIGAFWKDAVETALTCQERTRR
ncbi:hypothetical protein [Corynebacterium vitaeruminis]|nr:hypothetical protein [Corynebacterium vitaeruminis]